MASRAIIDGRASALPLDMALSVIPGLPRPLLARLVERAIERLDAMDGDPDLEPDDPAENDDPGEDEGDAEHDMRCLPDGYSIDQRIAAVGHGYAPWHIDREQPLT